MCDQTKVTKKLIALSFAFIYECFSTFLTLLVLIWKFCITRLIRHHCYQQWVSDTVLHKIWFPIFQAGKEWYQLSGQRNHQLENNLVCHLSSLLWIMCRTKNWKLHTCSLSHVTRLGSFKKNRISSKTFHTEWNISSIILDLQLFTRTPCSIFSYIIFTYFSSIIYLG